MFPNPYIIIAVIVGLISAAIGGYVKGYVDADRSAVIEVLKDEIKVQLAEKAELRRQAQAAQDIAKRAADRELEVRADLEQAKGQIDDYARALAAEPAKPPGCDCSLSGSDVDRLRGIAAPRNRETDPTSSPVSPRRTGPSP